MAANFVIEITLKSIGYVGATIIGFGGSIGAGLRIGKLSIAGIASINISTFSLGFSSIFILSTGLLSTIWVSVTNC